MGSLESRIDHIEDYLHSKDKNFMTPRLRAEQISNEIRKPEHLGEKNALVLGSEVNSFINSFNPDTYTDDERKAVKIIMGKMIEGVNKSKIEKSLKQNLTARLKQCLEKLD